MRVKGLGFTGASGFRVPGFCLNRSQVGVQGSGFWLNRSQD